MHRRLLLDRRVNPRVLTAPDSDARPPLQRLGADGRNRVDFKLNVIAQLALLNCLRIWGVRRFASEKSRFADRVGVTVVFLF